MNSVRLKKNGIYLHLFATRRKNCPRLEKKKKIIQLHPLATKKKELSSFRAERLYMLFLQTERTPLVWNRKRIYPQSFVVRERNTLFWNRKTIYPQLLTPRETSTPFGIRLYIESYYQETPRPSEFPTSGTSRLSVFNSLHQEKELPASGIRLYIKSSS